MVQLIIGLLLLAGINSGHGQVLKLGYGEKDFSLYHDATEPVYSKNVLSGQVFWQDQAYLEDYLLFHSDQQLLKLNRFMQNQFYYGSACSQEELVQNIEYLRYAHRLVVLSYLLEINEGLDTVAKRMLMGNVCSNDWQQLTSKCAPSSDYMKTFLKNAKFVLSQIRPTRVSADESGKRFGQSWLEDYKKKADSHSSMAALRSYCRNNKCQGMDQAGLKDNFAKLCQYNRELFQQVCSEKDSLMGMSYIAEMFELVGRSNMLNMMDSASNPQGCLRIFSLYSSQVEKKNSYLDDIVPVMYSQLVSESGYLQGRLFPAGALMEFNIKGLTKVFEDVKKIEAPVPVSKIEEQSKVEDVVAVTKVDAPAPKRVVAPKPVAKVEEPKPKEISKSAFQLAVEFRNKYDLDKAKVDMMKFKFDYVFTLERTKKLENSLTLFMQRASIEEMYKLDGLGQPKAPVPLVFIKFMIDKEKHQGLFNLVGVLGNEFYVKNTIDPSAEAMNYVQLLNDESTGHKWQINILKNKSH